MSDNKTILITGATDGIGKITAQKLARQGHTILLHGRNQQKLSTVADEIRNGGNQNVQRYVADFSSLEEVHKLAEQIKNDHTSLDVLINNAGVAFVDERRETSDGYELCFQVNYLAPFLLTNLLLPSLESASSARIINVASGAQQSLDFDDPFLERSYSGNKAYGQSKLALITFTFSLAEKLEGKGVTANTLHPGTYLETKMVTDAGITPQGKPEDGADAIIYLAMSSELDDITGKYFNQKNETKASGQAYDAKARKKLWELSEKWTRLREMIAH